MVTLFWFLVTTSLLIGGVVTFFFKDLPQIRQRIPSQRCVPFIAIMLITASCGLASYWEEGSLSYLSSDWSNGLFCFYVAVLVPSAAITFLVHWGQPNFPKSVRIPATAEGCEPASEQ